MNPFLTGQKPMELLKELSAESKKEQPQPWFSRDSMNHGGMKLWYAFVFYETSSTCTPSPPTRRISALLPERVATTTRCLRLTSSGSTRTSEVQYIRLEHWSITSLAPTRTSPECISSERARSKAFF